MPLFDIRCQKCENLEENVVLSADEAVPQCSCGGDREKVWGHAPKTHIFKEGWYEHLASEPIYITSKKQLKQECKERNLFSEYAWD